MMNNLLKVLMVYVASFNIAVAVEGPGGGGLPSEGSGTIEYFEACIDCDQNIARATFRAKVQKNIQSYGQRQAVQAYYFTSSGSQLGYSFTAFVYMGNITIIDSGNNMKAQEFFLLSEELYSALLEENERMRTRLQELYGTYSARSSSSTSTLSLTEPCSGKDSPFFYFQGGELSKIRTELAAGNSSFNQRLKSALTEFYAIYSGVGLATLYMDAVDTTSPVVAYSSNGGSLVFTWQNIGGEYTLWPNLAKSNLGEGFYTSSGSALAADTKLDGFMVANQDRTFSIIDSVTTSDDCIIEEFYNALRETFEKLPPELPPSNADRMCSANIYYDFNNQRYITFAEITQTTVCTSNNVCTTTATVQTRTMYIDFGSDANEYGRFCGNR